MKKTLFLLMSLACLFSCGYKTTDDLSGDQLNFIYTSAGMLARNLAYLPGSPGWCEPPGESVLEELELLAQEHTDVWPLFFRAAADSAGKIEQIELQTQHEAIQAEML
jgi:hypothetical protein